MSATLPLCSAVAFNANDEAKTVRTDGSLADTQNAINYAKGKNQDGWTVSVGEPGGSYTWDKELTVAIHRPFTLQGASPTNRPKIASTHTGGQGIYVDAVEGKTITVRDLIFTSCHAANTLILVGGAGEDCFRFTNLRFEHQQWSVWVSSPGAPHTGPGPYGLIDHCEVATDWTGGGIFVRDNPKSNSWLRPMSFGTKQAVYIEDCTFTAKNPTGYKVTCDADNGGRTVFRHNKMVNYTTGNHGADSPGPLHSSLQFEVMHNTYTVDGFYSMAQVMFTRGGTGVFFDNTLERRNGGEYTVMFKMSYYRAAPGNGVANVDRFYPADYPGTQQPGMGVRIGAIGQDKHHPLNPWVIDPMYIWDNKLHAPVHWVMGEGLTDSDRPFIQKDRDYFLTPKPGYKEFTYPHPLQTGSSSTGPRPSAPSNVQVTPRG